MTQSTDSGIILTLTRPQSWRGLKYQVLNLELTRPDRIIHPEDLIHLELPSGIDTSGGVVISGRGPIWLYGYLIHELHPTAWVACHDPRLGAVVVATHSRQVQIGQALKLEEAQPAQLSPALMVVGPPDSGKSVFAHALFQALLPMEPNVYLQRANWDGEGNYVLEMGEDADLEAFKVANKGQLTPEFFGYHAEAILALRRRKALVIVDVGGMVQPEKQPILEACSHYLIISSRPEVVESWHQFCRDRGNLVPVAVIQSVLEEVEKVEGEGEYLEIVCGPWIRGRTGGSGGRVPGILLERVKGLLATQLQ